MITVESFFNQVTDPQQILASIKEILAAVNPQFAIEERKYKQAAKILLESAGGDPSFCRRILSSIRRTLRI